MIRISKSVQNDAEIHIGNNSDHGKGSGEQVSCTVPPNFGEMPPIPPELANNVCNPNYWLTLVAELMK